MPITNNNMRTAWEYRPSEKQFLALTSQKKIVFFGGGVGCGKTDIGTYWVLRKIKEMAPGQIGLIAANSYGQLKDSTLRSCYRHYAAMGVDKKPEELPPGHLPLSLRLWDGRNFQEILCRSLDSYEMLSGMEIAWAWLDEVWQTKKEAIDVVLARLRDDRNGNNLQMLMTTTLDEPDSAMYRLVVDGYDPEIMDCFYSTTYDNEHNLPPGYIDGLKTMYTKPMFDRMVLSKWVALSGGKIYYNFDRNEHVSKEIEFDPRQPILWSHDFNIGQGKPMSSCLCQARKRIGIDGKTRIELVVFDEIILESSDTSDAINEFESRKWINESTAGVMIYGDASGQSRDTRSRTSDYALLSKVKGFRDIRVPSVNPPIRDRHNAVNTLLKNMSGDIRLRIHPRCKTLIKGLETVLLKPGAGYVEIETFSQHVTTALGYLIHREFPVRNGRTTVQDV